MSHKHYRTPAKLTPQSADWLEKIKSFLGKVIEKTAQALEAASALPMGHATSAADAADFKNRQIATLARIGIAACRTLVQALKMTGTDTAAVEKLMNETVQRFEQRIARQAPQLQPAD